MNFNNFKIGFDAKRAVCNNTGIGNYSRTLIQNIASTFYKNQFFLYSSKYIDNPRLEPVLSMDNVKLVTPEKLGKKFRSVWRSLEIPRLLIRDGIDIYHGLSNELPLNIKRLGIPSVVTIHDLIWRRIPSNYSFFDRNICEIKARKACTDATKIIAISECTKRDIIEFYNIEPEKIDVVYQGISPIFFQAISIDKKNEVAKKYSLPKNYIISVGTIEYRKNQLLAVKALKGIDKDISLVLVGKPHKSYYKSIVDFISRNGLSDRVLWLKEVDFSDLPALYSMAIFSSYTSRYEGFGLPVVESLAVGTPVIAATGSCLEEAGGRGALYINPDDTDEYIAAANKLIEENYFRDKLVGYGKTHIKKFNNDNFAINTVKTYVNALFEID